MMLRKKVMNRKPNISVMPSMVLIRGCSKIIAGLCKNWSIHEEVNIPFVPQASAIHHRIAPLVIERW